MWKGVISILFACASWAIVGASLEAKLHILSTHPADPYTIKTSELNLNDLNSTGPQEIIWSFSHEDFMRVYHEAWLIGFSRGINEESDLEYFTADSIRIVRLFRGPDPLP